MQIHRGTIIYYDSTNHLANVRLWGSHPTVLPEVPLADDIDPAIVDADDECIVVVGEEGDAGVVLCVYGG